MSFRQSLRRYSTKAATSDLFQPFQLGSLTLTNRFVMSPMTRCRAGESEVLGPLTAEYYQQRASAGLIVSEAAPVSPQGRGYIATPGIYTEAQVAGWKKVNDALHAKGGKMFCQLWHVGRMSHPSFQPDGGAPVAPSAVQATGKVFASVGFVDAAMPRALRTEEVPQVVAQFHAAAKCAKAAGFDGVELHGANGYLIHQFLADKTNQRTDRYGGSVENRVRFAIEAVQAVLEVWESSRVGIRLAPISTIYGIEDSNPVATYTHLIEKLNPLKLGFIDVVESSSGEIPALPFDFAKFRQQFKGVYMANSGYTLERALVARQKNTADLISIGVPFISNPDLVRRFREGAPLNTPDPQTFFGGGAKGYTDYPALK